MLAEPFIKGRELTVAVLNGEPLAVTELKPKAGFYDYDAKYTDGLTQHVCPAEIPAEIAGAVMDMAARAHRLLGCKGASRSDFRWDDELGEAGHLPARSQHPAGNDSLEPGSRAGEAERRQLWRAGRAAHRGGARVTAAHVRRGGVARAKPRKSPKVAVPKRIAKQLPVNQARANRIAGLFFAALMLAIGVVVLVALDIPAKAERAAGDRDRRGRLYRQRLSDRRHQSHGPRRSSTAW